MDGNGIVTTNDFDILDGIVNPSYFEFYCTAQPTVSGGTASIGYQGTSSISANDLLLLATGCPPFNTGLFITGLDQADTPLGNGNLCIGTQTLGFVSKNDGCTAFEVELPKVLPAVDPCGVGRQAGF